MFSRQYHFAHAIGVSECLISCIINGTRKLSESDKTARLNVSNAKLMRFFQIIPAKKVSFFVQSA